MNQLYVFYFFMSTKYIYTHLYIFIILKHDYRYVLKKNTFHITFPY